MKTSINTRKNTRLIAQSQQERGKIIRKKSDHRNHTERSFEDEEQYRAGYPVRNRFGIENHCTSSYYNYYREYKENADIDSEKINFYDEYC